MNFFSTRGVTRYGVISCLIVLFPPFALAQDGTPNSFWDLETKYIFGFTEGSHLGPQGERAIESDTNLAYQRRQGSYNALEQEIEYETNPTQDFQIEASVHGVYNQIQGVNGFDNFNGTNFGGLSTDLRYLLIGRGPGSPVGVTVTVEPEWARVDDGGKVVTSFAATVKILADTELVPDRLYAAFNAIYIPSSCARLCPDAIVSTAISIRRPPRAPL
jgi:hypothetical protein